MSRYQKILVTGGAGYIGSHTCVELLNSGFNIVVLDNLSNSSAIALDRVMKLTGRELTFIKGDVRDAELLDQLFMQHQIDAVIHFAGLKSVGESQELPLVYFDNNIVGSITLIKAMKKAAVYNLIFSSSATVYDFNCISPLTEEMETGMPLNNYGYTKLIIEQLLQKEALSYDDWSIGILRYFNPIGAHESGMIGEDPQGIPNNLMPYITQVAIGKRKELFVYGDDYETRDGTGIRDYIHVVDLAKAHLSALNNRFRYKGSRVWNIGTGQGISVFEVKEAFEKVNRVNIPYVVMPRRAGDIAISFADNSRALQELDWAPVYCLKDMVQDSWNWQSLNPRGYR